MRWIRSLEEISPGRGLAEALVWLVPPGLADEAAARATREDMADAALLGARRGAERLVRRRLARALAARALGVDASGVRFQRAEDGAQSLVAPAAAYVSASGRDDWCLVALGLRPLGVDVERASPEPQAVDKLFDISEQLKLMTLPHAERAEAFGRLWAIKEAWAKAARAPLDQSLKRSTQERADVRRVEDVVVAAIEI